MKKWLAMMVLAGVLGMVAGAELERGAEKSAGRAGAGPEGRRDDGHEIFRAIAYDAQCRVLTVEFRQGYAYQYRNVPPETHGAFVTARSKGAFYNERLRGRYTMERAMDRCLTRPVPVPAVGPRAEKTQRIRSDL